MTDSHVKKSIRPSYFLYALTKIRQFFLNLSIAHLKGKITLIIITSLMLVWATAFYELNRSKQGELREAEVRTQTQAHVFSEFSLSTIKRINEILLDTRPQWNGDWKAFAKVVNQKQESTQDLLFQIAVIDPKGIMVFSNLAAPTNHVDLSEREHFRVHKESVDVDRLFISKPVKGKVSGKWSIQFTRPILLNKKFNGVLVASVSPDLFSQFAQKLDKKSNSAITIVNDSGQILARSPIMESSYGEVLKDRPFLGPNAPISGNYLQASAVDGVDRVFGFYRLPEYGLIFVVGEAVTDVLKPYYTYRKVVYWVAVIISIYITLIFLMLFRYILTLEETKKSLDKSQERLIMATTAGGVGIWEWDIVNDVLVWDAQMYELYGITKDQFSGAYEAWQSGVHPDDKFSSDEEIQKALRNERIFNTEFRVIDSNGDIRHLRALATVQRDADGKPVRMIGTNWDITEQKLAEKRIEELAFFDHLTSLPNRRLFADRLQRVMKLSERSKQYYALLSIDIDNFKTINDLHGHDGGDLALQVTAQNLLKEMRTGDTVARMGGDEFVILLEDLSPNPSEASSAAKLVAEKILAKFNASDKLTSSIPIRSLSIGITTFMGSDIDPDELLRQSDLALYQAKGSGRNCIKFYDQQMQALINKRTSLEAILRQAIENNWFELHYQPQIDSNQRIESAEALLRLNHPQRGLIYPGEFIDLAESTDLILLIGRWVLNAACQQLVTWSSQSNMAHLALSVNISIKQFQQLNFASQIIDTVVRTGANPKLITLELTESLFLEGTTDAIQKMQTLKDYGFNFSLDDFGTGYSSLSYLKSLPFDELKIDQIFVAETPGNQVSNDIVRTIILMGQTLGLKVVAEGVESKDQFEYLQSIGCLHYQGYLFFHPMSADELVLVMTH